MLFLKRFKISFIYPFLLLSIVLLPLISSRGDSLNENKSQILLDALWKEIYGESLIVDNIVQDNKIPLVPEPSPNPPSPPQPKKEELPPKDEEKNQPLSKGEQYVQDALKKNKEILKQKREQEKLDAQKKAISSNHSSDSSNSSNPSDFYKEMREKQNDFIRVSKKDVEETYAQWEKERSKFLGRIEDYKKNLVEDKVIGFGSSAVSPKVDNKKILFSSSNLASSEKISKNQKYDYHIVKNAFDLPIRDQGQRPTCASFAGIRALEILLKQQGRQEELSEQYFYWASKPDCQGLPCEKRGSWVVQGFDFSKAKERPDVPRQIDCPYVPTPNERNETQIPLSSSCIQNGKGVVKVARYSYAPSLGDVIGALKRDKPVVGGFKLSEEFYKTRGLVTGGDIGTGAKLNAHALGHAMLIVGYMQMPAGNKQVTVGDYCLIVANSWGEGYGKGGHACLGEKWLKRYRFEVPFVVLEDIQI